MGSLPPCRSPRWVRGRGWHCWSRSWRRPRAGGDPQWSCTIPALHPCGEEGGWPRLCQVQAIFLSRPALPCQQRLGSPLCTANSPAQAHLKVSSKSLWWRWAELLGHEPLQHKTSHNGER